MRLMARTPRVFPLWAALLAVAVLLVSGCGGTSTESTSDRPSSGSGLSTPTPASSATEGTEEPPADAGYPEIVSATESSITVGSFTFRVLRVVSDKAIFGMVPKGMASADQIVYVEFQLPKGQHKAFAGLSPDLEMTDSGEWAEPAAWVSGTTNYTLTDMTLEGIESTFSLTKGAVALAYVVPKDPGPVLLNFDPEIVDLTPLMP